MVFPRCFKFPAPMMLLRTSSERVNSSERKASRGMSAFRRVRISGPPLPVAPPRSSPGGRRRPPARFFGFCNFPLELLGNSRPLFRVRVPPHSNSWAPPPQSTRGGGGLPFLKCVVSNFPADDGGGRDSAGGEIRPRGGGCGRIGGFLEKTEVSTCD